MPPRIDLITSSRADYGLVLPVARGVAAREDLDARLVYTGSHFEGEDAARLEALRARESFPTAVVPCAALGGAAEARGRALGEMLAGFAGLWSADAPAMVLLLGDRYELLAPATAALAAGLPLAHAFGGEVDVSHCLDTQVRDALTKMAHAHFVSHEAMAARLERMGEEPWRITVAGNPALDALEDGRGAFAAFAAERGLDTARLIAACYLPPTTLPELALAELEALVAALGHFPGHDVLWAGVNADPGAEQVRERLARLVAEDPRHHFVDGLGNERFHGLLATAAVLVGNSSAGLLEAASFGLPVVNVGVRQTGRLAGRNVLHVPGEEHAIRAALDEALHDAAFRAGAASAGNPFAREGASARIAAGLAELLQLAPEALRLKRNVEGNPLELHGLGRVPEYPGDGA